MRPRILIAGGGPAGASAAVSLVSHDVDVVLFEATSLASNKLSETLYPEAEVLLNSLGIDLPRKEALSVTYIGKDGKSRMTVVLEGEIGSIDRNELDSSLRRSALEAGAEIVPIAIERVESNSDGVVAWSRGKSYQGSYFIDATGKNPITLPVLTEQRVQRPLDNRVNIFSHFENTTEFSFRDRTIIRVDGGYAYVLPIRERRICVGFVNYAIPMSQSSEEWYSWQISQCEFLSRRLIGARRCLPAISAKNCDTDNPSLVEGRIFRVGDALGFKDPFMWDGLSFAIETGVMAAKACGEACLSRQDGLHAYQEFASVLGERVRRQVETHYKRIANQFDSSMLIDPHVSPLLPSTLFSLTGRDTGAFKDIRARWNEARGI